MTGLRAALEVPPEVCPLAEASSEAEEPITSISWSSSTDGTVTEEFTAGPDFDPGDADLDAEPIFDYGSARVYRFERDRDPCLCGYLEEESHPIADVRAEDGNLVVTLHLDTRESLRDVVTTLRDRFGSVRVRYLLRDGGDTDDADLVLVDRGRLTDRQREVLATAYEMGYFATPRKANATEVATELDIDVSTFTEHLAAAQSTLMEDLLAA